MSDMTHILKHTSNDNSSKGYITEDVIHQKFDNLMNSTKNHLNMHRSYVFFTCILVSIFNQKKARNIMMQSKGVESLYLYTNHC